MGRFGGILTAISLRESWPARYGDLMTPQSGLEKSLYFKII
jgi:hypothetical protein